MGKIVDKNKKKKKKGRPSLLDLQKRTLKQQQQQHQFRNRNNSALRHSLNYNSATPPSSLRRSRRRNPAASSPDAESQQDDEDEEEEDEDGEAAQLNGKRREKKLKLVLKLPSTQKLEPDSANGSDSNGHEGYASVSRHRKRKINAISDGSGFGATEKREKSVSPTNNAQDWESSTPLPDKKLLLFILDRLQKKDTHGVFSEPVDPDELPDYHEVIAHPMDFGTVRKKISSGAYATLEQFEKDVYLISSNAMQYNAPDTIYFRQARSIHELAKKSFENLRQDSDDNDPEPKSKAEPVLEPEPEPDPEPKVARRGRPPTKHLKKPPGRPPLAQAHSDFSFNANLITGGESTLWSNNDMRKGHITSDLSRKSHGSRIDAHWSAEKNIEATGSIFKGSPFKYGKKQFAVDENRRNTYNQFSSGGREPSVLATFDAERKQLVAVGLLSEHGYARSLARFAANIGTVAWKIASTRIERSLPPGVSYGPGWVGENDIPPQRPMFLSSSPQSLSLPENSCNAATSSKENLSKNLENNSKENGISPPASTSSPSLGANKSEPHLETEGSHCNSNKIVPRPPFQTGMNGFHMPAQMGKLVEPARPTGFNFQSSSKNDSLTRNNTSLTQCSQNPKPADNSTGSSTQPRPDSVPPDLNVIFQSPGSPSSNNRVESGQPDLALQL